MPPEQIDRTVLFVGLGAMGRPMAGRLAAADLRLKVADADPELTQRVATEIGAAAVPADGLTEAAAEVACVVLMLPDSASTMLRGPAMVGIRSSRDSGKSKSLGSGSSSRRSVV